MSILIKCMKKPQRCAGCYMFLRGLTMAGVPWQECAATEYELSDPFGSCMPDWCPIAEIQPHGRLIDADELMRTVGYDMDVLQAEDIHNAPTVIDAEGDEV